MALNGARVDVRLAYGSSGPGTLTHLAMEQFKVATDLDMTHAAYRGIGPAFTEQDCDDVAAGVRKVAHHLLAAR